MSTKSKQRYSAILSLIALPILLFSQSTHKDGVSFKFQPALYEPVTVGLDISRMNRNRNLGDTIWSSSFDIVQEWSIDNYSSSNFGWLITDSITSWYLEDQINSPSSGNYALLTNGNPTVENVEFAEHIIITDTPIDISGYNSHLLLSFYQYFARFQDTLSVEVSVDNQNWLLVEDNSWIDPLTANGGSASENPNFRLLYLPNNLITGAQDLWIRFRWKSGFGNSNEGVCYGWMIDDVVLQEANNKDLSMDENFFISSLSSEWNRFYTHIPENHARKVELAFSGNLSNVGLDTADSAFLQVNIDSPLGRNTISSFPDTLMAGVQKLFHSNGAITPFVEGKGIYDILWKGNAEWNDDYSENNSIHFRTTVSDTTFALDDDNFTGLGQFYPDYAYQIGNLFTFEEPDTISSISVLFHPSTSIGAAVQFHVYDGTLGSPLVSSGIIPLEASEIGQWTTFDLPDTLLPSGDYIAAFETFGDTILWSIDEGSPKNDELKTFVEPVKGDGWFYSTAIPLIRLNVKSRECPVYNPIISIGDSSNCGQANGILEAVVPNISYPLQFNWTNELHQTVSDSNTAALLNAGVYHLEISDSTGCFSTSSYALSDSNSLNIGLSTNSLIHLPCHDDCNGIIDLEITNNTSIDSIIWSNSSWSGLTQERVCAGDYWVKITDTSGCTSSRVIQIEQPLTALSADVISTSENTAEVMAEGGNPPYAYTWSNALGDSATGQTVNNITGGLEWQVTITDQNGCSIVRSIDVISSIADNNAQLSSLKVYPNPATDHIRIIWSLEKLEAISLSIFDLMGRSVYSRTINSVEGSDNAMIRTSYFESGVYLLVIDADGLKKTVKLIIR